MKKWIKPQYVYIVLAVLTGVLSILLLSGWPTIIHILIRNDTIRTVIGGVGLMACVGSIARATNAPTRAREREVAALQADLRSQQQATSAQQERNRLARDLHDSIKQQLFSIQMSAAAAQARWESDPEGARKAVDDVRDSTHEALAEMNAMLQQLSPMPLEKVGLVQALRDQAEALGYRTGAEVSVNIGELPDDEQFPPGAQEALFRIAQEALSNIARHARAQHVTLSLSTAQDGEELVLEVHDDGQGFDPASAPRGMGLNNICQRVETLGGELDICSEPSNGTTLRASLRPVPPADSQASNAPLNKTVAVGLAGGLLMTAALFYPLYRLLPKIAVPEWPAGSPLLGALCALVGAGIAVGSGFVAARRNSAAGTTAVTWGALAGSTVALIAYMLLGAATSSVLGLDWGREPYPAWMAQEIARSVYPTDVPFMYALYSNLLWAQRALWIALLSGAGLGAIGGQLAARRTVPHQKNSTPHHTHTWLALGSALSGLILLVIITVVNSMATSATYLAGPVHDGIRLVINALFAFLATTLTIYLVFAGGMYIVIRNTLTRATRSTLIQAQIEGVVFGSFSIVAAIFGIQQTIGFFVLTRTFWGIITSILLPACAGLGILHWLSLREARKRWRELGLGKVYIPQIFATFVLSISLLLLPISLMEWPGWITIVILACYIACLIALWKRPYTPQPGRSSLRNNSERLTDAGPGFMLAILTSIAPYLGGFNALISAGNASGIAEIEEAFIYKASVSGSAIIGALVLTGLSTLVLDGIIALVGLSKRNHE